MKTQCVILPLCGVTTFYTTSSSTRVFPVLRRKFYLILLDDASKHATSMRLSFRQPFSVVLPANASVEWNLYRPNYSRIFYITEDGCKFKFWDAGSNMAAIYTFFFENFFASVRNCYEFDYQSKLSNRKSEYCGLIPTVPSCFVVSRGACLILLQLECRMTPVTIELNKRREIRQSSSGPSIPDVLIAFLQSHIHSFERFIKGFSHLSCHRSFFFYDWSWNLLAYNFLMAPK